MWPRRPPNAAARRAARSPRRTSGRPRACRWPGCRAGGSRADPRTRIGPDCASRSARSWCQSYPMRRTGRPQIDTRTVHRLNRLQVFDQIVFVRVAKAEVLKVVEVVDHIEKAGKAAVVEE